MNRRHFLLATGALGLTAATVAANKFWPEPGITNPCLTGLPNHLQGHPLMQRVWSGVNASQVWDSHVHLVGTGDQKSGVWFNKNMDSNWHPILKLQKYFYMNGACAINGHIDISTINRMVDLVAEMPSSFKTMLFAFDWFHDENGSVNKENSIFYIPNEYAAKAASEHPQYFEWVASIHPYRADAIDALQQAHAQGARAIKWLPSGMGINPMSARCDRFYQTAHDLNLPIISHTGRESSVQGGNQDDGNPLCMRRALDAGVRVVLAHCASDGDDEDLDNNKQRVKSFALFTRMMDEAKYKDLLVGEISALTLINHAWALKPLLQRADWHSRLLNG